MSNRSIELWVMAIEGILIIVGMLGLLFWALVRGDDWRRRDTKRLVCVCGVFATMFLGLRGVSYWHYWNRTNQFAEMIGSVPVSQFSFTRDLERYKEPGKLWFGGAYTPDAFDGLGWCTTYETEGHRIKTLAIDGQEVVFVDVYDDGYLDAVYPIEKKKGLYPLIVKHSKPRVPTQSERQKYDELRKFI